MSVNQSRGDKNEPPHYRRSGRSGRSANFSGGGGGGRGHGGGTTGPSSSAYYSSKRIFECEFGTFKFFLWCTCSTAIKRDT
ncbi:hypothetical protein HanPI659440_Chr00c10g0722341 [Helianthus annuus]|nr:hypothetical protein HanPI659440_Chr00c10g0722341 [Helianthus annuus]